MRIAASCLALVLGVCTVQQVHAENMYGLKQGKLELKSISTMSFGPDGILFVGDAQNAKVVALDPKDVQRGPLTAKEIPAIDAKIAEILKVKPEAVQILDLTVNPMTGKVFLAVAAEKQAPRILKINGGGLVELDLNNIAFSEVTLPNPAEDKPVTQGQRQRNNRPSAITNMKWVEGRLLVSGLTNDKAASNVWSLHFPFDSVDPGTTVEFYHAAHGRTEDYAPIRTFVPFMIDGKPNLLAGFVCTPLVKIPLDSLTSTDNERSKVVGTTVAELGNRNQPLDLIAYKQGGKDFLLLTNSARGVMKISTDGIAENSGLVTPVSGGGTAGQAFETISELNGTIQLDKISDAHAAVLLKQADGNVDFRIIDLP